MYCQDESCIAGHLGERAAKSADDEDGQSQGLPEQDASAAASTADDGAASAPGSAVENMDEGKEIGEDAEVDDSEGTPSEKARYVQCLLCQNLRFMHHSCRLPVHVIQEGLQRSLACSSYLVTRMKVTSVTFIHLLVSQF